MNPLFNWDFVTDGYVFEHKISSPSPSEQMDILREESERFRQAFLSYSLRLNPVSGPKWPWLAGGLS